MNILYYLDFDTSIKNVGDVSEVNINGKIDFIVDEFEKELFAMKTCEFYKKIQKKEQT